MARRFPSSSAPGLQGSLGKFIGDAFSYLNPSDPGTWPSGDPIWTIARAIARAEGYEQPGSAPQRYHNPGDLSKGDEHGQSVAGYTTLPDGETLIIFSTAMDGWQALYEKLANIAGGQSSKYQASMTWQQIGQEWAGNSAVWSNNVAKVLGVPVDSTLAQFVAGEPAIMPNPVPVTSAFEVPVQGATLDTVSSRAALAIGVGATFIFVTWLLED